MSILSKGCVLVVDDHHDSREMLVEYLAFAGFDAATAADGEQALARVEQLLPDVVLMDLHLPGSFDGWEATRRIKENIRLQHIVVIGITSVSLPEQHVKAFRAGCAAVFVKPLDLSALAAHLEQVIGSREGHARHGRDSAAS
jgi:CheY-like chemotaxis protein